MRLPCSRTRRWRCCRGAAGGHAPHARRRVPAVPVPPTPWPAPPRLRACAAYCGDRIVCRETNDQSDRLLYYAEPSPEGIGAPCMGLGRPQARSRAAPAPATCLTACWPPRRPHWAQAVCCVGYACAWLAAGPLEPHVGRLPIMKLIFMEVSGWPSCLRKKRV